MTEQILAKAWLPSQEWYHPTTVVVMSHEVTSDPQLPMYTQQFTYKTMVLKHQCGQHLAPEGSPGGGAPKDSPSGGAPEGSAGGDAPEGSPCGDAPKDSPGWGALMDQGWP